MSLYIRLSTQILTDPKLMSASPEAYTLWSKGLLYSKEHLTDGVVPEGVLPLLGLGFRGGSESIKAAVEELTAGEDPLWTAVKGGYTVGAARWAKWQTTKEQVKSKREADQVRMAEWREEKRNKGERKRQQQAAAVVTNVSQRDNATVTDVSHLHSHSQSQSQSQSTEPKHKVQSTENSIKNISAANAASPRPPAGAETSAAELIYQEYPRKEGHGAAIKAIEKAVERVQKGEGMMPPIPGEREARVYLYKRVQTYACSAAGSRADKTMVPHPSTWFNQSRYLDDDSNWNFNGDKNGTSHGNTSSPAHQRVSNSKHAFAAAAERFRGPGPADLAGADGRALPSPGSELKRGGIPVGLPAACAPVLTR